MSNWIKNEGITSEHPVPHGTIIDAVYRDCEQSFGIPTGSTVPSNQSRSAYNFQHINCPSDIMAWRLTADRVAAQPVKKSYSTLKKTPAFKRLVGAHGYSRTQAVLLLEQAIEDHDKKDHRKTSESIWSLVEGHTALVSLFDWSYSRHGADFWLNHR